MRCVVPLAALAVAAGCAGPPVRPSDLPPSPGVAGPSNVHLVVDGAPEPMAAEARAVVRGLDGWREATLGPDQPLTSACDGHDGVVVRPSLTRTHFMSNTHDRNVFLIYETAVVAGIPVALVSLAAWPWDGETIAEGQLEVAPCDGSAPPRNRVESFRIRSEGRGLITEDRLRDAQNDAAVRGVTRKLFAAPRFGVEQGER